MAEMTPERIAALAQRFRINDIDGMLEETPAGQHTDGDLVWASVLENVVRAAQQEIADMREKVEKARVRQRRLVESYTARQDDPIEDAEALNWSAGYIAGMEDVLAALTPRAPGDRADG